MKYNKNLHTLAAREAQIAGIIDRHPETFIVGSIGRAAVVGYDLPVNKGRYGGETRDIDITTTKGHLVPLTDADQYPFPVDNALRRLIRSDSSSPYATVVFDPKRPDVSVELPTKVFEPFVAKVGKTTINTFHPDTLRRLHMICNSKRRKDRTSIPEFERALAKTDYLRLPDEYFEPLIELHHMVANDQELSRQYQNERILTWYGTYVPAPVRALMRPFARPLRKASGIVDRHEEEVPPALPVFHP